MALRQRSLEIRKFILNAIGTLTPDLMRETMAHFGISRQAVSKHIKALVDEKRIFPVGKTRARKFYLRSIPIWSKDYPLAGLSEDKVWRDEITDRLGGLPDHIKEIWEYGFTEMLNNAIDHSDGEQVKVTLSEYGNGYRIDIHDNGIGIFRKIQEACDLEDERHAVLELAKGKLTTDPENHTGEGIFFSSRSFDKYYIHSGGVIFDHAEAVNDEDWIHERKIPKNGTQVVMHIANDSPRHLGEVFEQFAAEEGDFAFTKTVVPVNLVRHGEENLVSRSQAKRLMSRVERFKTVVLDFAGVEQIGQAFADEIFRVFVNRHPETNVLAIHAKARVQRMIDRAERPE